MSITIFNEEERLWSSDPAETSLDVEISIGKVILDSLKKNPSKIIQINHETNIQLTSEFLRMQTIRAAQNLQKLGYQQNQIFAIVAMNSHYVTPIVFAALCIGCPFISLDTSFNKAELLHMLKQTKPNLIFCDKNVCDLVRKCLKELRLDIQVFTFSGQADGAQPVESLLIPTSEEDEYVPTDISQNTIAAIICTSGSTGLSKGVVLSHATLLYQISQLNLLENDVCLTFSSLYWISGLLVILLCAIKGSCRLITTDPFSTDMMLEMIEEHRVTYLFSASHFIVLALKCEKFYTTDLSSLRAVLCGGSKLSESTANDFSKHVKQCKLYLGYGMSEVGGLISMREVDESFDGSMGNLLIGYQAKIVDDDGNRMITNEIGEICLKNKFLFLRYHANAEATAGAFDSDGFLTTGDIGYFNEANELFLVDRKKDMIKYCSSQISPTEIEGLLIQLPGIKAVCVVGIPDPVVGDLPAAVIVANDNEQVSIEDIDDLVSGSLADYKRLRGGVYFVDTFPLTPSGKIIRRLIKQTATKLYKEGHQITEV